MKLSNKVRQNYENQHRIYERKVRPYFYNVIISQNDKVINWISENGQDNIPYDLLIDANDFSKAIIASYLEIGLIVARREYYFTRRIELDTKIDIQLFISRWKDLIIEFSTNYAYRIQNELSETSRNDVIQALIYAQENDITGDRLVTFLRKRLNKQISRFRANLIARTEATTASNYAKEIGARTWINETGQQGYKGWISRMDERVRHNHLDLNDTYIKIDDLWDVGGQLANAPGDTILNAKERISCRCTQVFLAESTYLRLQKLGQIRT